MAVSLQLLCTQHLQSGDHANEHLLRQAAKISNSFLNKNCLLTPTEKKNRASLPGEAILARSFDSPFGGPLEVNVLW